MFTRREVWLKLLGGALHLCPAWQEPTIGIAGKNSGKSAMTKTSSRVHAMDGQTDRSRKGYTADYIGQMAAEMASMSHAAGLPLLAHLLKLAQAQAEIESRIARTE
jgi:hypothetical protein